MGNENKRFEMYSTGIMISLLAIMLVKSELITRNRDEILTEIDPDCEIIFEGLIEQGDEEYWNSGLDCIHGSVYEDVQATGFYPSFNGLDGGCIDLYGEPFRTLQDYLQGKVNYVSVAMDESISGENYGAEICIPELNKHFGKRIRFKVVDHSPSFDIPGDGKIDICARTEKDSLDEVINRKLTVYMNINPQIYN